ncbi:gliding motility-associated C-terminal domain-containing protein [Lewinella sp. W8]|uniref:gliding motility-associated C-terminal domain-containing protein n=1 Tax=Lewinella sp. W8 TaxID=2528208 RepID=UPI001067EC3C|nr:gliding motility-associated C-terminal domain-containing protein [Lewinella sp. W8]MTB51778.1 T9SS type B sorting domain-containing protein [Lewinella sp. W8]
MNLFCRVLALVTIGCLPAALLAQPAQANNWHFGSQISVRFVDGQPVLNPPSAIVGFEGVVSLSDTLGNLLFYTNGGGRPPGMSGQNGGTIWNRNHEVMYDMRGEEGGGFSARQSAIAMPAPGNNPDLYYLFTMEETEFNIGGSVPGQPLGRGLSYFTIDMSLNGGLGEVVLADQRIFTPSYEGLDATPMADGEGYWIICQNITPQGDFNFVVTPLTANGVGTPTPVSVPNPVEGKIKFSPDGSLLFNNGFIYEFDPSTGEVGNTLANLPDISDVAVTFTPDSRYLYTTEGSFVLGELIVRYDMQDFTKIDVARLEEDPAVTVLQAGPFQIGPNGNIYFLEQNLGLEQRYGLSEIECVSSPVPVVNRLVLDLTEENGDEFASFSPPQFVDAIFKRPVVQDTLFLDTLMVDLCPNSSLTLRPREAGTEFLWTDGSTADSLAVSVPGTYCVTVTGGCQPTVDCQRVEELTIGFRILDEVDRGCDGDFLLLRFAGPNRYDSIRWTISLPGTPDPFIFTTDTIEAPLASPNINVSITGFASCGTVRSASVLDFIAPRFAAELAIDGPTGEVCAGDDVQLSVLNQGRDELALIQWFDGSTEETLDVNLLPDEEYFVDVIGECGDSIRLFADFTFTEECDCEDEIPEIFSPNRDGTNDLFRLYTNCSPTDYTLIIYNRWGQVVFESTNPDQAWDGSVNGIPQNSDVYLYRMAFRYPNADATEIREGQFSLIR